MKRRICFAVFAFGLACLSPGARAAPCQDVGPLVQFIEQQSEFTGLPRCLPVGRFEALSGQGLVMSQAGAYDPVRGTVAVAADLDLTGALGQSYLLHELVHYAQFHSDVAAQARCPAFLEAQAYALQVQFLQDRGEGDAAGLIRVLAGPLSVCNGDTPDY